MKKGKVIRKVIIALAVLLAVGWICMVNIVRRQIMDGPGMVFNYREQVLVGDWVEANADDPILLHITEETMEFDYPWGTSEKNAYELSDEDISGIEGVRVDLANAGVYDQMIVHWEEENGMGFHVLSGTLFELDGRGLIIGTEFVKKDVADQLPKNYISALAHRLNDAEPTPTYMMMNEETGAN